MPEAPEASPRPRLRDFVRWAELDPPLRWALAARTWAFGANTINVVLIAAFLSPAEQGYYFTFGSLLGLQVFLDLGFSTVIAQFAAHEWALVQSKAGPPDAASRASARLASLVRLAFRWYGAGALVFGLGAAIAGYAFFSGGPPGVAWAGPWLALVAVAALNLSLFPLLPLLEGCNQVLLVNRVRFLQGASLTLALAAALLAGAGLWAAPAAAAASLAVMAMAALRLRRSFLGPLLRGPSSASIGWRSEFWPMQWRLALSSAAGYLMFSLFSPVLFHVQGPVVAGQMGLTWALAWGVGTLSFTWVQTRVPAFGMLIAERRFAELDALFGRVARRSVALAGVSSLAVFAGVAALHLLGHPLAQRLLPPLPAGLLLVAGLLMQVSMCQSAYLRAHKQEPLLALSLVSGALVAALLVPLAQAFGAAGAAAAYLLVVALVTLPWGTSIWRRCRRAWHDPAAPSFPALSAGGAAR